MIISEWPTKDDILALERECRDYFRAIEEMEEKTFICGRPTTIEGHNLWSSKAAEVWEQHYQNIYPLGFSKKNWSDALKQCNRRYEDPNPDTSRL